MSTTLPATMRVLERGWLSSNNVLFTGPRGTALIDTGYLQHAPQTLALVRHGLQERPLDRMINTHLHSDHCGGNALLQAHYGCRVSIPHAEAAKVAAWDDDALSFVATGQRCERFTSDDTVRSGDVLELGGMPWQAMAAPGHDPHSLVFFCASEGILISADALWGNGFGVVFPELDGDSGFAEVAATLDMIDSLGARFVIPGHGAPFTDVQGALARARSRLDYLAADPVRNAQNAVKVLLKFLLIEHGRFSPDDVARLFTTIPVVVKANRRFLQLETPQLATWAMTALLKAGAARMDGDLLVNND